MAGIKAKTPDVLHIITLDKVVFVVDRHRRLSPANLQLEVAYRQSFMFVLRMRYHVLKKWIGSKILYTFQIDL